MADQMTPLLCGAYGHPVVKTPNLVALSDRGARFDAAYTPCPICSPARSAFMTGRYPSSIGAYDNASAFSCDLPTFAHQFSAAGYDTVLSGKMHFIGPDQLHGFDRRLTTDIYPSDFEWTTRREQSGHYGEMHAQPIAIDYATAGVRQWSMQFDYDEETHFRALEYLRSRRLQVGGTMQKPAKPRDETPFLLCVSYTHPHEPFHVTPRMWDEYEGESIDIPELNVDYPQSVMDHWLNEFHGVDRVDINDPKILTALRRSYYALVSYVDKKIGELLCTLDDTGLSDNTIILFMSDHGDMLGERGMVQKRCFYEMSARVPLIVCMPDGRYAGRKVADPVSLIDVAPTLLDLVDLEADHAFRFDGSSLVPALNGRMPSRPVFSELHTEGVFSTCFMVRDGDMKYISVTNGDDQLFELNTDPRETKNLVADPAYQEIVNRLRGMIDSRFDRAAIEDAVSESLKRRQLIRKAMRRNGTHWDYGPHFDPTLQYWREG